MNILFVCKYNRFRSRVAEAYFKKVNKNKRIKVKSGGLIQGSYPIDAIQLREAKKYGININGRPKTISTKILKWVDVIVIVANDVSSSIFESNKYRKKLIVWKIKDVTNGNDMKGDRRVIKQIMKKIEGLVKQLESKK